MEIVNRAMPAKRQAGMVALLRDRGAARISELAAELDISESTVRRDLDELATRGIVSRTHGGALIPERTAFEPLFEDRCTHNAEEKRRIGELAVTLLEPDQSVLFDSSSTVLSVAAALVRHPIPITAVTNDIGIASTLAVTPGIKVIMPGGEVREGSLTLLGSTTQSFLDRLHVDVVLVGIHAITGPILSEGGIAVAEAKQAMLHRAGRSLLLADHSKFGPPAFFEVSRIDAVDDLITDDLVPTGVLAELQASASTRVHLA